MKTLNYKLISVKSCVIAAVLFFSLTLSVQSAFSQRIENYYQGGVAVNDWHSEEYDYGGGGGAKDYTWRITYDLFDWGIWNIDTWVPNTGYGTMSHSRLQKKGYDSQFTELTLVESNGYRDYYPGQTHYVFLTVREVGFNLISGLPYTLYHTKGHYYVCTY